MTKRFAICIESRGCDDLQIGKVYTVVPDKAAAARRHLRVIDDSNEDYLYPANNFVFVDLPQKARRALIGRRSRATTRTS